jgi:hypothetical protein
MKKIEQNLETMKKLILSAVAVLFTVGAFAQTQGIGYGIKAGVNLPTYHFSDGNNADDTEASTNFHVTGFLDAPITSMFSIQPGVSLQGKGAKLMDNDLGTLTQNTMWVEIPVNAVVKFPAGGGNFFLGAGPYAAFGISGKNSYKGDWGTAEQDFDFDKNGSQKGTEFGANFLAGYQLSSGLTLGAGYGMGLSDIAPEGADYKQNNRVLSFSVGFAL